MPWKSNYPRPVVYEQPNHQKKGKDCVKKTFKLQLYGRNNNIF